VSVAPGATLPAGGNRVLIHFTADADGRMPPAAVWQPAAAPTLTNRGPARLDVLMIEMKDAAQRPPSGTPPEALDADYGVDVTPLVDNDQVFVARHRYEHGNYGGPYHSHPEDVILVYLRAGYTWPADGYLWATRFRRGDVEVVPANTLHRIANAGFDPLEVLIVIPR
jgi:quercetin dioxygenase-like cupin family protein